VAYRRGDRYEARLCAAYPHLPGQTGLPFLLEPVAQAKSDTPSDSTTLQLHITTPGTLEHLTWTAASRRPPGPDEIEIQVTATGLNFRDVLNALGLYPGESGPLGLECVGTVVAIGEDVSLLKVGDEVMAIACGSVGQTMPVGFSQFVTISAQLAVPIPSQLSHNEAATLPVTFLTAYYSLCEIGQLATARPEGRAPRILIHAAAGGVGQAAVQIAQQAGADIYATASPQKWDMLRQQGIRHVFSSRTLDFADDLLRKTDGQGVDLVLNSLSGESIFKSLSTLTMGGQFIEIGKVGIWSAEQIAQQRPDVTYHVIDLVALTQTHPEQIQVMLRHIRERVQQQQLQPLPMQAIAGDRVIDAFRLMQQGKHVGKVVVTPPLRVTPSSEESSLSNQAAPLIRPDATYLITGGLGALGLRLARWLVNQGARYLILLGRRSPTEMTQSDRIPSNSPQSETAQQVIHELTETGATIQVLQADLAQFHSLQTVLSPFLSPQSSPLPPLKGIFHLAGCIDDGILQQQTWSKFETVMAAKVQGTWHLHQLSRDLALDHMVLFSSAASLLGSAGQSNYAAANAFLDAIAHYRHRQGLPALSINWGAWAESGMSTQARATQRLSRAGQQFIPPDTGLDSLAMLMTTSAAQIGVLPGDGWMNAVDPFFSALQPLADSVSGSSTRTDYPGRHQPNGTASSRFGSQPAQILDRIQTIVDSTQLSSDLDDQRASIRTLLLDHVRQHVAIVLGLDVAVLTDPQSGFTDLGLDSLTAIELRNRLQTTLERPFSATLIYDYPTLSALTDYLLTVVMPETAPKPAIPSPSTPPDQDRNTRSAEAIANLDEAEAEAQLLEELKRIEDNRADL